MTDTLREIERDIQRDTAISQRTRAVALAAFAKIYKNRRKDVPGKWPKDSFIAGERTWNTTPLRDLYMKLIEEAIELYAACQTKELADQGVDIGAKEEDPYLEAGDVAAMAMMLADRIGALPDYTEVPKVVCLCGSTKFKDQFIKANFDLTMRGIIVLTVGFFAHSDTSYVLTPEEKQRLDTLHKQKIDLSDGILVINVGGYIGDSTKSEIQYAIDTGKSVNYLEPTL